MSFTAALIRKASLWAAGLVLVGVISGVTYEETVVGYDAGVSTQDSLAYARPATQQQRGESGLPWLFAVYIVTWAAFFGYAFVLSRRQREMRSEIEALQRVLSERKHQAISDDGQ